MQTWEECHAAGMNCSDAARALGKSRAAASKWASKNGVVWAKMSKEEMAKRIVAGQPKRYRKPYNAMGQPRRDEVALPPMQERTGGRFWMINNKTGEKINKHSSSAIYLQAMLLGWTDWDWGTED